MSYKYIETKSVNPNKGMMCPQVIAPEYTRGFEEHKIYDAGLCHGAKLHRFKNYRGECSGIYFEECEVCYGERENEAKMIKKWNDATEHENHKDLIRTFFGIRAFFRGRE